MKRLCIPLLMSFLVFFYCSENPTTPKKESGPGSANVNVKVGKVGKLGIVPEIELSKLYISLTAPGEATIYDTFTLSGNSETTIQKTYNDLASVLKTWTLTAEARDVNGEVIHSGTQDFIVPADGTINVSLNLDAKYSMLRANFYTTDHNVKRCELLVDEVKVDESSIENQTCLVDTLKLAYNYLRTGILQRIKLNAYGTMEGADTLLYTGDTTITPLPAVDTTLEIILKRVGSFTPPPGKETMSVTLESVGTAEK